MEDVSLLSSKQALTAKIIGQMQVRLQSVLCKECEIDPAVARSLSFSCIYAAVYDVLPAESQKAIAAVETAVREELSKLFPAIFTADTADSIESIAATFKL